MQRRGSGGLLSPRPSTQSSPNSLVLASRPRSASLCSTKKSFLGISKTRPTSVKLLHRTNKQGTDSAKDSSTHAIDAALEKIRSQLVCVVEYAVQQIRNYSSLYSPIVLRRLALQVCVYCISQDQLSEEDQIMEDRVNRLMREISQLMTVQQNPHSYSAPSILQPPQNPYRLYKRTLSDEPLRRKLLHNFDGHQGNINFLSDLKETVEEFSMEKGPEEEEVDCVPSFDLVCKEFEDSPCKRGSLDSTGSAESATEPPAGEVCVVIVTDTTENSSQGTVGASQTSGSSQAEDDVFFSQ